MNYDLPVVSAVECKENWETEEDESILFREGLPPDVMTFQHKIPEGSLAGINTGDIVDVVVSEIYSVSHFWLYRLGTEWSALKKITDEIKYCYEDHARSQDWARRSLPKSLIRKDYFCVCRYQNDWRRAVILKIIDERDVKVRYVDYGLVVRHDARGLRPLLRRWAELPMQAVRGRLAKVRPCCQNRFWLRTIIRFFRTQALDQQFTATVTAVDIEENALEVMLETTRVEGDFNLSHELITLLHAEPRTDPALGTSQTYLFPKFEHLESNATPNYEEVERLISDGIEIEFVEAIRRYMPTRLPPLPPAPYDDDDEDEAGAVGPPAATRTAPRKEPPTAARAPRALNSREVLLAAGSAFGFPVHKDLRSRQGPSAAPQSPLVRSPTPPPMRSRSRLEAYRHISLAPQTPGTSARLEDFLPMQPVVLSVAQVCLFVSLSRQSPQLANGYMLGQIKEAAQAAAPTPFNTPPQ